MSGTAPQQAMRLQFAKNLKQAITRRGITKSELARSAKISRNTLDMILSAKRGTTIDVVARLAGVLNVPAAKLFAC